MFAAKWLHFLRNLDKIQTAPRDGNKTDFSIQCKANGGLKKKKKKKRRGKEKKKKKKKKGGGGGREEEKEG